MAGTTSKYVDLSYTLSESDKSIWPGNPPIKLETVREDSNNPFGCFISMVHNWIVMLGDPSKLDSLLKVQ